MKRIIIADDDPGIQEVMKILLKRFGYEPEVHPDAERLLNNDFKEPLLFIIDWQLQDADGLDICRMLKARENKNTPVILFSASTNMASKATLAGADAFLEKPFEAKHFIELVKKVLEDHQVTT